MELNTEEEVSCKSLIIVEGSHIAWRKLTIHVRNETPCTTFTGAIPHQIIVTLTPPTNICTHCPNPQTERNPRTHRNRHTLTHRHTHTHTNTQLVTTIHTETNIQKHTLTHKELDWTHRDKERERWETHILITYTHRHTHRHTYTQSYSKQKNTCILNGLQTQLWACSV